MRTIALLGAQHLDQVGEVGLMQRKRELADLGGIALIERRRDGMQEVGANAPLLVAQFDLACGVLHGLSDRQVELRSSGRASDPEAGMGAREERR